MPQSADLVGVDKLSQEERGGDGAAHTAAGVLHVRDGTLHLLPVRVLHRHPPYLLACTPQVAVNSPMQRLPVTACKVHAGTPCQLISAPAPSYMH